MREKRGGECSSPFSFYCEWGIEDYDLMVCILTKGTLDSDEVSLYSERQSDYLFPSVGFDTFDGDITVS